MDTIIVNKTEKVNETNVIKSFVTKVNDVISERDSKKRTKVEILSALVSQNINNEKTIKSIADEFSVSKEDLLEKLDDPKLRQKLSIFLKQIEKSNTKQDKSVNGVI